MKVYPYFQSTTLYALNMHKESLPENCLFHCFKLTIFVHLSSSQITLISESMDNECISKCIIQYNENKCTREDQGSVKELTC